MTGINISRSSHPEVFSGKKILKICSKFTAEHPCRSVISIKLQSNFIENTLLHGCCPVNLLHIFLTPFPKHLWVATSGYIKQNKKSKDYSRLLICFYECTAVYIYMLPFIITKVVCCRSVFDW